MIDGGCFASIKISVSQIDWFSRSGLPLVFEASGNTSFGRPVICRYFKGCSSVCELERYKDESRRALDIPSLATIQRGICFSLLRFRFVRRRSPACFMAEFSNIVTLLTQKEISILSEAPGLLIHNFDTNLGHFDTLQIKYCIIKCHYFKVTSNYRRLLFCR